MGKFDDKNKSLEYVPLSNRIKNGEAINLGEVGSFVKCVDPRDVKVGSVVECQYQEITKEMKLRNAFIIRIRDDKLPNECSADQL